MSQTKKQPKCKNCGGAHYKTFCFSLPKKQITKNPKPKKRQRSERQILISKLDKVFADYIKLKDAKNGHATCVTCGDHKPWYQQQNGHFISRRKMQTRWDERNCNVQCPFCNENLGGNLEIYESHLVMKYGREIVDDIKQKANSSTKVTTPEIEEMLEIYNQKLEKLLNTVANVSF